MKKDKVHKLFVIAFWACLLLVQSFRIMPVSGEENGIITIKCDKEGMQWELYKISEVTEDGKLKPIEVFSGFKIPDFLHYEEEIQDLAYTLENYITLIHPEAVQSGKINNDGELVFSGLEEGWYIAVPKRIITVDAEYVASSSLICITGKHLYSSVWGTNITIVPKVNKFPREKFPKKDVIIQFFHEKSDYQSVEEIVVEIYHDGKIYDHVVLDEGNNWSYIVPDVPDDDSEWVITQENTPDKVYPLFDRETVMIKDKPTYIISVWNRKEEPDYSINDGEDKPESSSGDENYLPQTGQLWWPVPILTSGGLLTVCLGVVLKRKERR